MNFIYDYHGYCCCFLFNAIHVSELTDELSVCCQYACMANEFRFFEIFYFICTTCTVFDLLAFGTQISIKKIKIKFVPEKN